VWGIARPGHAQERRPSTQHALAVPVRLHNNAGVPTDVLTPAKAYTADVYSRIGVALQWLNGSEVILDGIESPYTIVLMTPHAAQRKAAEDGVTDEVVGQAAAVARRAYIYYERVVALAQPPERDVVTFLGYVMAHEFGHLLLPGRRHASAGIMRASFPLSSRFIHTFTAGEEGLIRNRLQTEAQRRKAVPTTQP
jgi:hypothetical protein